MNMQTNLAGRLRNTPLPFTSGLLPFFDAVVNSIHAIEEAGLSTNDGRITVEILRKPKQEQLNLADSKKRGPDAREDIIGFRVTDNGIGFTNENMQSFHTLDSEHKVSKGGRGIGRLLWLKAFKRVNVESTFAENGSGLRKRTFIFDASGGVSKEALEEFPNSGQRQTTVHLDDFNPRYRDCSRKTSTAIADQIFEHCLWYFIREGSAPLIEVLDDGERISLHDVFEAHMHSSAVPESIVIKGQPFNLVHVKLRSNSIAAHAIAFCADNRLVTEEKLAGKIPGLHGWISDGRGDFIYSCYVSSPFLDECARPERTGFEIVDNVEGLLEKTEISLNDIRDAIVGRAKEFLSNHIRANLERSKERVARFVATKGPRYRPILARIPDADLNVDPEISDKDLDLTLHKHLADLESQLLTEGHDIMAHIQDAHLDEYEVRLKAYLDKAEDIKRSDLASYVSHRRVIIDLFEKAIQRDSKGAYVREDLIHRLIMPMQVDSNESAVDGCNLWLIDERLAFHEYLASDKTLVSMPITNSKDTKEPDICALNIFDQPILVSEGPKLPPASIVVIEIKRPMRDDAKSGEEHDPIEQAIGYLRRLRDGGVKTSTGRPIPASEHTPGFCYILADLAPKFQERCEVHHDLKRTADGLGYFGYKENCKAFVEVISFDRLVSAAKERNRAFFDRLGLPAN